nr:tripartite tricarboxylate transporter substrate binding protein [Pseudomonadota bacterium]
YPNKPIHIIVPFPPGGPSDYAARLVSQHLSAIVGQPVIVENHAGGAGITGTNTVARSAPDGYTLLVATVGAMVIAPYLFPKLPYDPFKDFAPITNLISGPTVLVVYPSVPAHSVQELIALAKAKPDALTYGSTGVGQISHLNGELFKSLSGIDILHVPYKGAAPLMTDMLGGQLSMYFATAGDAISLMNSGRVRALAVTSPKRIVLMPETPTMDEAGLKGYDVANWNGIWAPAGTPRAVLEKLNRDIAQAMSAPDVKELVAAQGNAVVCDSSEEFATYIHQEASRWSRVVREARIKIE